MQINKDILPIFFQPWWLDITCGIGAWGYAIVKDSSNETVGVLPFFLSKKFGFSSIRMPAFTPYQGAFIAYPKNIQKRNKKYNYEEQLLKTLLSQLPPYKMFNQILRHEIIDWMPFFKLGFRQSTRYTYVIKCKNETEAYSQLDSSVKNKIRKAKDYFILSEEDNIEELYNAITATFKKQSLSNPLHYETFKSLHETIAIKKQGKILFARNKHGNIGAAIYLIWDHHSVYLWQMGGVKEDMKKGAVQLLIWKAIQFAINLKLPFNFEGSMLKNIEPVFRSFGGNRTPNHQIYKCNNRLFYAAKAFLND